MPFPRPAARILFAALLLALVGCGPKQPELYPLSGTLVRDNAPVTAGGLIFLPDPPDSSGRVVNASVNPDGTFAARTEVTGSDGKLSSQPGVPAGRYKVVYHPPGDGQKVGTDIELPDPITVTPGENKVALTLPPKAAKGPAASQDPGKLPD